MQNKKRFSLKNLAVSSFTTDLDQREAQTAKGGVGGVTQFVCSWLEECNGFPTWKCTAANPVGCF